MLEGWSITMKDCSSDDEVDIDMKERGEDDLGSAVPANIVLHR